MATSTLVGYVVALVAALTLGVAALISHHAISHAADERHVASENVLLAERLRATFALANAAHRGYLLTGEPEMRQAGDEHSAEVRDLLATALRAAPPEQRGPVLTLAEREAQHAAAVSGAAELRSHGESRAVLSDFFSKEVVPRRELVLASLDALQGARVHDLEVAEHATGRAQAVTFPGLLGLQKAPHFRPDVAFVDIGMPGMDGYVVARRMREDPALSKVVLVALTGEGAEKDKQRAQAAGFCSQLTKPVSLEALLQVLRAETTG